MKLRIFVDFWNFQLSINEKWGKDYRVDWKKISPWLQNESSILLNSQLNFEETRVYISFNPKSIEDRHLKDWAYNTLDCFPGIDVVLVERKPKKLPYCPSCHAKIDICPRCGSSMAGTIEKGVDTAIVTDLLSLAWEKAWDVAILISSDRDFIPAIETLSKKGYKIINAHFPPTGMELAKSSWGSIDLKQAYPHISR